MGQFPSCMGAWFYISAVTFKKTALFDVSACWWEREGEENGGEKGGGGEREELTVFEAKKHPLGILKPWKYSSTIMSVSIIL